MNDFNYKVEPQKPKAIVVKWPEFLDKWPSPTKDQTYARIDPESGKRTLIAYGGSNQSANVGEEYIVQKPFEGSLFGKNCIHVQNVCWMEPWARIESIP